MNALLPSAAPAAAAVAPNSAQPAVAVAVPVETPAVAQASAMPFVHWLSDAGGASTPHDDVPSPVVDVTEPMTGDDAAVDVAWSTGGAPDGLVRLGSSLSAAVPVMPSAKAPAEPTAHSTDEADAAGDPAQAAPPLIAPPVALLMPGIATPALAVAPAVVPPVAAQALAVPAPTAATLPTTPVTRAATLPIAASPHAPAPTVADDEAADDTSTSDQPASPKASAAVASPRASVAVITTDASLLALPKGQATSSASAGTSPTSPVDTATAAPRGPSLAALLALSSAAQTHDAPDAISTNLAATTPLTAALPPQPDPSSAPTVKLPATPPTAWQAPLLDALGDHVRLQLAQRSEQAVIRLDPPALGTVEIVLRHEAGVLQVQLSASHTEVQRQLLHIADSLRQDLSQRQYSDVSVQVATSSSQADSDGRQRQAQRQQAERDARPGRALAGDDAGPRFTLSTTAE